MSSDDRVRPSELLAMIDNLEKQPEIELLDQVMNRIRQSTMDEFRLHEDMSRDYKDGYIRYAVIVREVMTEVIKEMMVDDGNPVAKD